jgi:hypothetical protein
VGRRFGERQKIFAAVIDRTELKQVRDLSPREVERDHPELRRHEELIEFLSAIYDRPVGMDDWVTVVHFSRVREA